LAEVQRLEAEARRKAQEKERRVKQEKQRVEERKRLDEKIAARAFSRQYLGNLHSNVFEELQAEGVFYDPVEKEVTDIFLGETFTAVASKVSSYEAAQAIADELLEAVRTKIKIFEAEAIRLRQEMYERLEKERLEAERLKAEQAEAERIAAELAANQSEAAPEE